MLVGKDIARSAICLGDNEPRCIERVYLPRLEQPERSLKSLLARRDLHGMTISAVPAFSLAARRLGARVCIRSIATTPRWNVP